MDAPGNSDTHLTWVNVGLAFSFVVFDAVLSSVFGLRVGSSLVTAAIRCIIQLAVVATLLQKVFEAENPWAVAGIVCEFVVAMYL
jgi:ABC-type iron transport system FetAB permease component